MKLAHVLRAAAIVAGVTLASGGLAACTGGGCTGNPTTDNLGCSIVNQDKYRRDTIAAQDRAQAALYEEEAARADYDAAQRQLDRTRAERLALQDRVSRANRELALLEGQLQAKRASLSDAEYRLRAAELKRLRAEQQGLARAQDTPQARQEIQNLEDDIARLRGMLD